MRQHLGRREREARKWRMKHRKSWFSKSDHSGSVTLQLGRKKSSESMGKTVAQLKKRFSGCVVDAER